MVDTRAKIQTAREAGYSDEEIRQFLFSRPEAEKARQAGYSDAEIAAHFGLTSGEGIPGPRTVQSPPQQAVEYVESMLGNIPESTLKFAQGLYETATSPIETAKALGAAALSPVETAKAIGGYAAQRYGSPAAALETLRTDPVGLLADISTVAGGAGAALRLRHGAWHGGHRGRLCAGECGQRRDRGEGRGRPRLDAASVQRPHRARLANRAGFADHRQPRGAPR